MKNEPARSITSAGSEIVAVAVAALPLPLPEFSPPPFVLCRPPVAGRVVLEEVDESGVVEFAGTYDDAAQPSRQRDHQHTDTHTDTRVK
jgi:hypothetical protein